MNMSMFISQKIKVRLRPSLWDALVVAAVLAIAAALFLFLLPCNFPDFYLKIFYFKILIYIEISSSNPLISSTFPTMAR